MVELARMLRTVLLALAVAVAAFTGTPRASAAVLTFDDVDPSDADVVIPNGYGGLNWSNFETLDPVAGGVENNGYLAGTTSGTFVAFTTYGMPGSISASTPFDLIGGNFTGAWRDGLQLTITGFRNGIQEHTTTLTLQSTAYLAALLGWHGVDLVTFSAVGGVNHGYATGDGTQFAIDDLHVASTPTPGSLLLMVTGLGVLGGIAGATRRWQAGTAP
jgi:hypothetical protein